MRFALNHIAAPTLSLPDFFATARDLGVTEVEIRNDLPDVLSQWRPEDVKAFTLTMEDQKLVDSKTLPSWIWGDFTFITKIKQGAVLQRMTDGQSRVTSLLCNSY